MCLNLFCGFCGEVSTMPLYFSVQGGSLVPCVIHDARKCTVATRQQEVLRILDSWHWTFHLFVIHFVIVLPYNWTEGESSELKPVQYSLFLAFSSQCTPPECFGVFFLWMSNWWSEVFASCSLASSWKKDLTSSSSSCFLPYLKVVTRAHVMTASSISHPPPNKVFILKYSW